MDGKRKSGLEMVGDVPWGTHFCQFYDTKEDLTDILVPYFKAGIEGNEFCMWITSEPLIVSDAHEVMRQAFPDYDRYREKGQIEIIPYSEWYVRGGSFNSQAVLAGWVDKLNEARAKGYEGLRLTGNTFWLEKKDWGDFTKYEEAVNSVIGRYRMIALCTYSLKKCNASEVLDVVKNHEFALIKRGNRWESVIGYEGKKAEQALRESEQRYRSLFNAMTEGFGLHEIICDAEGKPVDYRFIEVNPAFEQLTGLKRADVLGRTVREVLPGIEPFWIDTYGKVALTGEPAHFEQRSGPLGRDYEVIAYALSPRQFAAIFLDATERKRMQAERARLATFPELNPNPVMEIDSSGNLRYANPAAIRRFPALKESIPRTEIMDLVASISRRFEDGASDLVVDEAHVGDSWFHLTCTYVRADKSTRVYLVDITELKRVEEVLRESEARLRQVDALLETVTRRTGVIISVIDNEFRYLYFNEAYREEIKLITGRDIDVGMTITEMFDHMPEQLKVALENWRRTLRGETRAYTLEFGDPARHRRIYDVRQAPILGPDGTVIGAGEVAYDITGETRLKQALQESQNRLVSLAENAPSIIMRFDRDLRIVYANPRMKELVGFDPAELIGKPIDRAGLSKEAAPVWRSAICDVFRTRRNQDVETDALIMGSPRTFMLRFAPELGASGAVEHVLGVATDITEMKRAARILERDNEDLARLVEEKTRELVASQLEAERTKRLADIGTLAATVAHELRNPLGAMNLAVFNLRRKSSDPALAGHLGTIEKKISESNEIIGNLLFYSRLRPPNYRVSVLRDVIEEAIAALGARREDKKVRIRRKVKEIDGLAIDVDPLQIKELLVNLLDNAYDAVPDANGFIEVGASRLNENSVRLYVRDNGKGMDDETLEKIWDPFFSTKSRGTGLGLSVCRQITLMHNGTIEMTSTKGKGTTATITLPLRRVPEGS